MFRLKFLFYYLTSQENSTLEDAQDLWCKSIGEIIIATNYSWSHQFYVLSRISSIVIPQPLQMEMLVVEFFKIIVTVFPVSH